MIPTAKKDAAWLAPLLDRLAAYQPGGFPFVSLYLNLQPDPRGRDHFDPFVRKELRARARTYPLRSPERESLERDIRKIGDFLGTRLGKSANGAAIFSCAADDLFEAAEFSAPIDRNQLYIQPYPQLYPLARVMDQYPRYGVLLTDTNSAHVYVVGLAATERRMELDNTRLRRTMVGGWSQARYQRHVDNLYLRHAKDVAEALERVIRQESLQKVVISGEVVVLPLLREHLPRHVADRLIEVEGIDMATPEAEMLRATIDVMRQVDARDDAAKVARVLEDVRAGGLGVAGVTDTLAALDKGQVDELLITANPRDVKLEEERELLPEASEQLANDLVSRARRSNAALSFIEDGSLLAEVGGVGARLRFRI
ncbi:MAG: hypothetical protein HY654_07250 [Acidobacteria bacterium]|nr:hypothetical protein [Acidobacteriota bacterium]